jgi:hypothetical protein
MVGDLLATASEHNFLPPAFHSTQSERETLFRLGQLWEPDFLLLATGSKEVFRLLAACVCFPSSWDLRNKMGLGLDVIHGPVPGLNSAIGSQINTFLARMKQGISWERVNWGLSRSPELDQHPDRLLQRLDESVAVSDVFLRIEEQSLTPLVGGTGILFGIRIVVHPLETVLNNSIARERLTDSLQTMPADVATYKGLGKARERILELLAK